MIRRIDRWGTELPPPSDPDPPAPPPSRTCRPRWERGGPARALGPRRPYTDGHVDERARLIGMNHVAVEVGDLDAALDLYGRLFRFELRGRVRGAAFVDMGDQFLAISEGRRQPPDEHRHIGLVVDDLDAVRAALDREGVEVLRGRGLDFRDPWGNRFQVVAYADIQFERVPGVKRKLGIESLGKTSAAREEIERRGLAE
jgi:lactoylglutathione lyase